jgi:hypothetical protein
MEMNESGTVERMWKKLKEGIKDAEETTLGFEPKQNSRDWFDEECRTARNYARRQYLQRPTRAKEQEYRNHRREADKICRRKKSVAINERLQQIEEDFVNNDLVWAYKEVNTVKRGFVPRTNFIRSEKGKIVSDPVGIKNRWREYFNRLLNPTEEETEVPEGNQSIGRDVDDGAEEIDPPTEAEMHEAIRSLKNNKASGTDDLPAEIFKEGGERIAIVLWYLMKGIWEKEEIPEDWKAIIICPIYKKGDKLHCRNYRGISLLCTAYKTFTYIMRKRLQSYEETAIGEYQWGFRSGRSTTDQLFVVRQNAEKFWEYNIDLHQLFIDFRQAYASINRRKMYEILQEQRIPQQLMRLIRMTITDTNCQSSAKRWQNGCV